MNKLSNTVQIINDSKDFFLKADEKLAQLFDQNKEALSEFLEEIKVTNTIGHHIEYVKICRLLDSCDSEFDEKKITYDYCKYYKSCSLYLGGTAPKGRQCPYEMNFVYQITQELIDQMSINVAENTIEKMMIGDYVFYALIKYRAAKTLRHEGITVTSEEITKDGTNYKTVMNPVLTAISNAESMMASLRKQLVADRESRIKLKIIKDKLEQDEKQINMLREMNERTSKVSNENKLPILVDIEA